MTKKIPRVLLFGFVLSGCMQFARASGVGEVMRLPYVAGEQFVVVQGYNELPTHIQKDSYAIDFSQNGCDAYGKAAVAVSSGKVLLAQEGGYNGGYGAQVLLEDNAGTVISRYAHLIPGTIPVANGNVVLRGETLGGIGNTGLVMGTACLQHPGTHLHFAMYDANADGSFVAHLAEPISGYTNITDGRWYLSDNSWDDNSSAELVAPSSDESFAPQVLGASTTTIILVSTSSLPASTSSGIIYGGVSVSPPSLPSPPPPAPPSPQASTTPDIPEVVSSSPLLAQAKATFNSSTLAIDLAWQPVSLPSSSTSSSFVYQIFKSTSSSIADVSDTVLLSATTSTTFSYPLTNEDFLADEFFFIKLMGDSTSTTIAIASTSIPRWFTEIQPIATDLSTGSWYDDNWYELGTGLSGVIKSLTLKGFINAGDYLKSYLYLDEYNDPGYSQPSQTLTISNDAPFTDTPQIITITGLNIPLQQDKYYRLRTYQDDQNRSVILYGTTATGTAMHDTFLYGTGRIDFDYQFYPYIGAVIIPDIAP
jgi:murein DD-endopeptidase MepM/ murein hydrolase activator NlpD